MSLLDDPRLTAFALGELEPDEAIAFEEELGSDPEALAELDAILDVTGLLEEALYRAPVIELAAKRPWRPTRWDFAAVAALALIAATAALVSRIEPTPPHSAETPSAPPAPMALAPVAEPEPERPRRTRLATPVRPRAATEVAASTAPFVPTDEQPTSSFGVDVETTAYTDVRTLLRSGKCPRPDVVHLEEMINHIDYRYPRPRNGDPFSLSIEVADCPWTSGHRLVRIGLQGRESPSAARTIAADVAIRVRFDARRISHYRLLGYDRSKPMTDPSDGEAVLSGHSVTALYEVIPVTDPGPRGELMSVALRWKNPDTNRSRKVVARFADRHVDMDDASADMKHAAGVALFGMMLRDDPTTGSGDTNLVKRLLDEGRGDDEHGARSEVAALVSQADELMCLM